MRVREGRAVCGIRAATGPVDPALAAGSKWHRLWPRPCRPTQWMGWAVGPRPSPLALIAIEPSTSPNKRHLTGSQRHTACVGLVGAHCAVASTHPFATVGGGTTFENTVACLLTVDAVRPAHPPRRLVATVATQTGSGSRTQPKASRRMVRRTLPSRHG